MHWWTMVIQAERQSDNSSCSRRATAKMVSEDSDSRSSTTEKYDTAEKKARAGNINQGATYE